MFCPKCGKQINDNSAFCPECGNPIRGQETRKTEPQGRNEIIVRQVTKDLEQNTINRHQCFGWKLLGNQEVNVTEVHGSGNASNMVVTSKTKTHIKLTFERNTKMHNYAILSEKYGEYTKLEDEYMRLDMSLQKDTFSFIWWLISSAVLTVVFTMLMFGLFFVGLMMGIGFGAIGGLIGGIIQRSVRRKKLAPRFAELDRQMAEVAAEAAAYLE